MSLTEAAKEFNRAFKSEKEKNLLDKIDELEKIIVDLSKRLDYLERHAECR